MRNKIKQIYKGFSICGVDSFFFGEGNPGDTIYPFQILHYISGYWLDSPVGQWGQWEWGDRGDTASDYTIGGATDGP